MKNNLVEIFQAIRIVGIHYLMDQIIEDMYKEGFELEEKSDDFLLFKSIIDGSCIHFLENKLISTGAVDLDEYNKEVFLINNLMEGKFHPKFEFKLNEIKHSHLALYSMLEGFNGIPIVSYKRLEKSIVVYKAKNLNKTSA